MWWLGERVLERSGRFGNHLSDLHYEPSCFGGTLFEVDALQHQGRGEIFRRRLVVEPAIADVTNTSSMSGGETIASTSE